MRKFVLIAAAMAVMPMMVASAHAAKGKGMWCSTDQAGAQNCSYSSKAQCMKSMSGVGGSCDRAQSSRKR